MVKHASLPVDFKPIKFGTDGWRGVIAADFTFERVALVAGVAAHVLAEVYGPTTNSRTVIIGYDRRFLAEDFARSAAQAVQGAGFDVLLSETYAPTPAFSWYANAQKALGAIVLTASHNPAAYLGLKVKGAFGGSVPPEVTLDIEAKLDSPLPPAIAPGSIKKFNIWPSYCEMLRQKVDIAAIRDSIASGKITVFADVMHGAASGGLGQILGMPIEEINGDRDPLFDGGAPEPLPRYLSQLFRLIRTKSRQQPNSLSVGLVFDGDADRIAAVDSQGNFLSSQVLIPILIQHLVQHHGLTGEVVKTVSGSDLIPRVTKLYHLPLFETAIGYKYIAERMLTTQVLIGGEESGGVGYGTHVPERDALLSALYTIEAIVKSGQDLSQLYTALQNQTDYHFVYDRIDLPLASMEVRAKLLDKLEKSPLTEIDGRTVLNCLTVDGYKFQLADYSWLLIRFSGTEPVLRLYCEAPTMQQVRSTLAWASSWANSV
ncbi:MULTISPECIES: phosphoglucomutase/phosphomannomutase family protein [Planktothricoides]|uniref:Phosphoglucomutase/phosphomannomutase family protein n=2 Tax=Planktothricoides raciborskii TaxID=132608 RepID=A0AAU8JGB2_9CYAN|nr:MULTISPECIES: phosphoglucomutase/phosphomannomutase family protein [Planktothricoides]KOR36961.1 phosphoglucosamine mutase [Planktothricoides sp. SR001]MBD2547764.1 phosphoglucomutase/phosphomannomutase family protein [Planktothricoides raciborskii FACHB-1370]MBD2584402.1 phosphoglucomutase/phosphomannomutase family protein [Planktothricoides raciborskii FACHB-1261]